MIMPMKKYYFLIYHKAYKGFLTQLQDLGVLHIIKKTVEAEEKITQLKLEINNYEKALKFLRGRDKEPKKIGPGQNKVSLLEELDTNQSILERINQLLHSVQKDIKTLSPWGNFSEKTIDGLMRQGIKVRFFIAPAKNFRQKWIKEFPLEIINKVGSAVYFVVFQKASEKIQLPAEEIKIPHSRLDELKQSKIDLEEKIKQINEEFDRFAEDYYFAIERQKNLLQEKLDFNIAIASTEHKSDGKVMVLHGWVPENKENEVALFLKNNEIVYLMEKPDVNDDVPIYLHNSNFTKLFEPIGKMFSLPSYHETDLTPFFAPFFALFFGLCLGDAGYGLVILIATFFLKKHLKKELIPILTLGQILGATTITIGILTGTIFGYPLADIPALKEKILLNEPNDLFALSLYIGIIQIILGMFIQAATRIKRFGFKYGLSTIGTIILIISSIDLYQYKSFVPITGIAVYIGLALVLMFNDPDINIFLRPLKGIYALYNIASGFLGDFLSYVRLFALGISSAILGMVINQIGIQLLGIPFIGPFLFILFLLLGHSGNLCIAGLGAFVHPMRLTFVEFYKNAGFSGGGKQYKPFAHKA